MMDDAAAIEKCRNGDWEAFRFLVERYQKQAVAHSTAILGNREDALDAAQEAFVDAFQALKRFDQTRRFASYFVFRTAARDSRNFVETNGGR